MAIMNFFRNTSREMKRGAMIALLGFTASLLGACGGGGASGGPGSPTTPTTPAPPTLVLAIIDTTTSTPRTSITPTSPARVTATVKTGAGVAIPNVVVTFTTDTMLATITPTTGTALTDANGVATVTLGTATSSGAGTITATAMVTPTGSTTPVSLTNTINFAATGAVVLQPSITLALVDTVTGAAKTTISSGNPARVVATVKNASGAAAANTVVTFMTDPLLGTFTPNSNTALTDASGVASIILNAASLTASGAANVTATSQLGTGMATMAVTSTIGYAVGAANITLGAITFGANPLSAFGTTSVSVTALNGGTPSSTPLNVAFSSPCAINGKAFLTATVATVNGVATASYRDNGCGGTDTITATLMGLSNTATNTITVMAPNVGSIQYVSAQPASISLKGTGGFGRQETSLVTFRVVDVGGNPLGGRTVNFSLNTTVGGIALTSASAISDAVTGQVVTNVQAGTVSTPVRVTATVTAGNTTLSTQSDQLTITTGIPSQDGFSLSASTHNIEGLNFDGTPTVITARLADHFRNPVPDGTAVNFTAEGGSIVGSCTTLNGVCSVTLSSQALRPSTGRVTVLAYAIGEEAFTDLNGNGLSDANERIDANNISTDIGEAFVDFNENGVRDANEPFIDFNNNGVYDGPDGLYNGTLCNGTPGSGICSSQRTLHVRGSEVIVFSGSDPVITLNIPLPTCAAVGPFASTCITPDGSTIQLAQCLTNAPFQPQQNLQFAITDVLGNGLPAGTMIAFNTTIGSLPGMMGSFTMPDTIACAFPGVGNCPASAPQLGVFPVPIASAATQTAAPAGSMSPFVCTPPMISTGVFTITTTTPKQIKTTFSINIRN